MARGRVELVVGPMFSGKTTDLMRRMRRYELAEMDCIVVKYARDVRYADGAEIATHDKRFMNAVACTTLAEVRERAAAATCIGIDEGQFFPDLVPFCEDMAAAGRVVVVAALSGTFDRQPFPAVAQLVACADTVTALTAVCMHCHRDAPFTLRIDASNRDVEDIGGADKYVAACRACHARQPVE
jgi:thymidine kinase